MPSRSTRLRAVNFAIGAVALLTLFALAALWPSGDEKPELPGALGADTYPAEVERVVAEPCLPAEGTCVTVEARLLEGPERDEVVRVPLGVDSDAVDVQPGDGIRLARAEAPETQQGEQGQPAEATEPTYSFADFERGGSLLWLALLYVAAVLAFARLRGALSLLGLGASLVIVLGFVVPAILAGQSPVPVAVSGALAVMLITIPLVHGFGAKSRAAILGTTLALALTVGLAILFTNLTQLTGLAYEEVGLLRMGGVEFSFEGLLLAGMVIGALGVLDDVTVSQASTVFAVRAADPAQSFRQLYARSIEVGRDHVAAVVNTLVLAYAGAALPVLLIFGASDVALANALNTEVVAREIVATLVGSIGLIVAVPITTAIAAWLASALPDEALRRAAEHGHAH